MERYAEMKETIKEYRIERIKIKTEYLNRNYNQLNLSLFSMLDSMIQQENVMQQTEKQGRIKNLVFLHLLTSGYTESYEVAVGMCSSMLYLDENMNYLYWKPEFIYDNIEDDTARIRKMIQKTYVHTEEYEILRLKQELLFDDWKLFCDILKKMSDEILKRVAASTLQLENKIQILCGNYMDKLNIVHHICTADYQRRTE